MRIQDFFGEIEVETSGELHDALRRRSELNSNNFYLWHPPEKYPLLNILVKGDLAYIHFFDTEDSAGRHPHTTLDMDLDGCTVFCHGHPGNTTEVWNGMVLPLSTVLEASEQFLEKAELPTCIEWEEL